MLIKVTMKFNLIGSESRRGNSSYVRINRLNSHSSSLIAFLNNIIESVNNENEDGEIDNIIQYLMANDPNKYGNPPTSKETLEKLKEKTINEDELTELKKTNSIDCSVCKDEFDLQSKLLKLPCNHYFHGECVKPWLEQRNSCPTCRYELPTDDADYELRKKQSISS